MKKIIERNLAEIIVISVIALSFSSCGTSSYQCAAYASSEYQETEAIHENLTQEEYNELLSCENCDEID